MYHFDYVTKGAGGVFESPEGFIRVATYKKYRFSFRDFLSTFVFIENFRHPFTITTTEKRHRKIDAEMRKMGYTGVELSQVDFDMGEENAHVWGYYNASGRNPFKEMK